MLLICLGCGITGATMPFGANRKEIKSLESMWKARRPGNHELAEGAWRAFKKCHILAICTAEKRELTDAEVESLPAIPRYMRGHYGQAIRNYWSSQEACPTCKVIWGYTELHIRQYRTPHNPNICAEPIAAMRCHALDPDGDVVSGNEAFLQRVKDAVKNRGSSNAKSASSA